MANRTEVFQGKDGQYYVRLVAENNEILMVSEGFPDEATAQDNVAAVEDQGPENGESTE